MFERYTEHARRALFFSREEATLQDAASIEPGHLLLGLIRERGHVAAKVLHAAHLSSRLLREEIERGARSPSSVPLSTEVPFSTSRSTSRSARSSGLVYARDRDGAWKLARAILSLDDEPEHA